MDGLEFYRAFYNLNSRINNILNTISNISFQPNSLTDANDPFIERFSRRVGYLKVHRPDYLDATRFSNVHSLEFYDFLSQQQLAQVRHEYFAHLVYLRMCYIEDSCIASAFFQMIFSNGFPSLYKCVLDELTPPEPNHRWLSSPSLHSLIIGGFALPVYSFILISCSNLTHLHWSTMRYTDADIDTVPVRHTHLKCLYIRTINIRKIETILLHVPNLKRLHIVSDWSRGNNCLPLDFKQLARILVRCVPYLYRFDCETMQRDPIDIDVIHGYHPCFRRIQFERVPDGRTRFFTIEQRNL
ncbi:unnamed protein product [Rotaria sp. Silwood2]|nr:unnamed protein product [Rotaria sp. Silwood2]CAF2862495.1 unnamed protein product [Rotaria sp. Silwood2]CAF3117115.1 unnamed protein product [Rotaria sp. Silwood2]CAF3862783.1 unnamed protein product [Rotaria sp. Silwood2]CAF4101268.1 unnamed protein product [Rotaria sp. Silwood2]